MPGLTRDGQLGKWIWEMAEQDALPLEEITRELDCQFNRFVDVFGRELTHIDSHHHVHMIPAIFPIVAEFAQRKGVAIRVDREVPGVPDCAVKSTDGFSSAFYGDEIDEALFLKVLDESADRGEKSVEVMAHPAFVDNTVRKSAYCWPRLVELDADVGVAEVCDCRARVSVGDVQRFREILTLTLSPKGRGLGGAVCHASTGLHFALSLPGEGRGEGIVYAGIWSILLLRDQTRCAASKSNSFVIKASSTLSPSTMPSSP